MTMDPQGAARAQPTDFCTHAARMAQIRRAPFTPTQRLLLAAASMFCGRTDRCYCTPERLTADVGCHPKTTAKLFAALKAQRLLRTADRGPGLTPWLVFDWAHLAGFARPGRTIAKTPRDIQATLFDAGDADDHEDTPAGGLTAAGPACGGNGEAEAGWEPAAADPLAPAPMEPSAPQTEPMAPGIGAIGSAPHTKALRQQETRKHDGNAPRRNNPAPAKADARAVCREFVRAIGWTTPPTPAAVAVVARLLAALDDERVGKPTPDPIVLAADAARRTRAKFAACKSLAGSLPYWREAYAAWCTRVDGDAARAAERTRRAATAQRLDAQAAAVRIEHDRWRTCWEKLSAEHRRQFADRVEQATPGLAGLRGTGVAEQFIVARFAAAGGLPCGS